MWWRGDYNLMQHLSTKLISLEVYCQTNHRRPLFIHSQVLHQCLFNRRVRFCLEHIPAQVTCSNALVVENHTSPWSSESEEFTAMKTSADLPPQGKNNNFQNVLTSDTWIQTLVAEVMNRKQDRESVLKGRMKVKRWFRVCGTYSGEIII